LDILIKKADEAQAQADVVILPVFEGRHDVYAELDAKTGGLIAKIFATGEFKAKLNRTALLHTEGVRAGKLALVGLGKPAEITADKFRQAGGKVLHFLRGIGVKEAALSTASFSRVEFNLAADNPPSYYFLEGALLGLYRFMKYKKDAEDEDVSEIKSVTVLDDDKTPPDKRLVKRFVSRLDKRLVSRLKIIAGASSFSKDLINMPSNDLTPTVLAKAALTLGRGKVKVRVLELKDVLKEGMGAFAAVAQGSREPLKFIVIEYNGGGKGAPVALVGKAITFDSGGISIKPSEGMEQMKYDMAGGGAVLGVVKTVSELALPVNLVAAIPATENMPGGAATRPGDIVTAITGKTVEIINTDAEGRLILADALGYVIKHFKPKAVIDIATLTGACSIALGNEAIAMMGNDQSLMDALKKASDETYERVWQMPLYDEYKEYLKSDAADLKNVGGRNGGLVTAAYFLKEFVGNTPWAHLDIASTAWNTKEKPYLGKGATAVGVRLIVEYLAGG
jgi:leucyl aminopeptidase